MKSGDLDKRLSAYLDDALAVAKRDRFERELERDPALQKQLKRSQALGSLVREAWTEGPAAPPPEFLIAALRPQLAAISRERRARPAWERALEDARLWLSRWIHPVPLATSAAAAFLLAIALLPRPDGSIQDLSASLSTLQSPPTQAPALGFAPAAPPRSPFGFRSPFAPANLSRDAAAGIYDVSPGEYPAMLLQNEDGSTLLWLLEDDGLSLLMERLDRWG